MIKLKLLAGLFVLASLIIFPFSVQAFSLGGWFSSPVGVLTKIKEKVEYTFAFSNDQKVRVLNKQAEKRLEKAQEQAQAGDEKSIGALVEEYKDIKGKQGELAKNSLDNNITNQIEKSTLDEQKAIKIIVDNVSSDTAKQVIDSDRAVISDIKKVVVVEGDEVDEEQFEQSVSIVWAEGTGPNEVVSGDKDNEKNNVVVVGGLPQYAPGTKADGESEHEVERNVKEIEGNVENEIEVDVVEKEE